MAELLKEALENSLTAQVRLIDNWTMRMIKVLPSDDAVAKYGDCEVRNWYTEGFCEKDAKGRCHRASVWIKRPGMHFGMAPDYNLTIADPNGTEDHAEFIGKKSGKRIEVIRHNRDDYEMRTASGSIRGNSKELYPLLREEA